MSKNTNKNHCLCTVIIAIAIIFTILISLIASSIVAAIFWEKEAKLVSLICVSVVAVCLIACVTILVCACLRACTAQKKAEIYEKEFEVLRKNDGDKTSNKSAVKQVDDTKKE